MNFEEYKAPQIQEIDFVDFYVVKDFGKMGLMTLKVPYFLLDMIGEDTPIEGMEVEHVWHTFDWPYRDQLTDEFEYHSPMFFEPVIYKANNLRYRYKGKLTHQREEFGDNVSIVITPVFNAYNYHKESIKSCEEQERLTEKFINDVIDGILNQDKARSLMDKAVAAHGISQKALDYFDEFKFLID